MYENIIASTNLFNEAKTIRDKVRRLLAQSLFHGPVEVFKLDESLFLLLLLLFFFFVFILPVDSRRILVGENFNHLVFENISELVVILDAPFVDCPHFRLEVLQEALIEV